MILRPPPRQPAPRRGLIDLHLHTTASDGRCSPAELVAAAVAAGVEVLAVTDHDTTAGTAEIGRHATTHGIETLPGIEITAVEDGADVHVLGYFIDPGHAPLQDFLVAQRRTRIERLAAIADRLARLGLPIRIDAVLHDAHRDASRTVGRPQVARAMIEAGYVDSMTEAFDRWLGRGAPAFVPRAGSTPEDVIATIHGAGGLASLAHPGRTRMDSRIEALSRAGLDALEAFHSDHDAATAQRYCEMAGRLGLLVTGGSDYHGDPQRPIRPGTASLPPVEWQRLAAARSRHA